MKIPIPDHLIEQVLRGYRILSERGSFDRSDTKVANALRVSGKNIEKLNRIINKHKAMEKERFNNHELCDGVCCIVRDECVRYMGGVDLDKVANPYPIHNAGVWLKCPHFLGEPDPHYPRKQPQT